MIIHVRGRGTLHMSGVENPPVEYPPPEYQPPYQPPEGEQKEEEFPWWVLGIVTLLSLAK